MVQEHSYNSCSRYVPDPRDSKTTYKAMVTDKHASPGQKQAAATTIGGNKNKKSKTDVWGPVYQNRQHFVDMHIC